VLVTVTRGAPQAADGAVGRHFRPESVTRPRALSLGPASWPRGWPPVVLISAVATLFSWRDHPWRTVSAGVSSWQVSLAMGFLHHLQWGPRAVFTFGPLGFVEDILPFSRLTAGLALLYALVVTWGLAALIVSALRRPWGLLPAGVVAWACVGIAANLLEAQELALATALGLALAALRADGERARLALLGLLGALAGLQLLVELNVGLVSVLLLVAATACGARSVRAVMAPALPFVGVAVAAWAAAGQSLSNLASYWEGALSVTTGYSSAMALSAGRQAEDWYAVVDGVLAVLLFASASRGRSGREKAAIFLMVGGLAWEAAKEGFVRHDRHDLTFLGLALVVLCLARLPRVLVPLQAGALALAGVLACLATGAVPATLYSPRQDAGALAQEVRDLSVPGDWGRVEKRARAELLATGDRLPPPVVGALVGRAVAVEPWGDAIDFAYPELRWQPLPVLQAYAAYTGYLDHLDAAFLFSAAAPERLLYQAATIDERDPFWDPPAAVEAMYCRYAQVTAWGAWQLLTRVPDRCGHPRLIGRANARFGEPVAVPQAPREMIVATFSLSSPLSARAEAVLLKPPQVRLTAWGVAPSPVATYRFIPGTAGDVHVLAVPAALGYSSAFSPPSLRKLEFSGGGWTAGHGSVTVAFYAVSLGRAAK